MRWERVQQLGLGDSSSQPGKRWGHTCNAIKGGRFLYVFGGFVTGDCLTNQVHVFDVETQLWTLPVINGVPPCPRDSHTCTTVGDNLFVFGGTDGTKHLNDLHILDTSSHTWICPDTRGEGPGAREAHSAALVDKRLFIFGGCAKSSHSDDEVFYNDLYILNTETLGWKRAVTSGKPPSGRDSHTCSTWKNKIIVIGGEDLDDYYLADVHILDTDNFVWKEAKTSGQLLTARAGHVTIALEMNLFVFGGLTESQYLYNDLYVLNLETGVWSKVVAMEEGPSPRFSCAAVSLDPYKAGLFFFVGGCNKNLEPLDDIYYLDTEGQYSVQSDQAPGQLSLGKRMKLKCQRQKLAVPRTNIDQGRENPLKTGLPEHGKETFEAKLTLSGPLGHTIETIIDGQLLHGVLFSNRQSSVQMFPSFSNRKRPAMSSGNSDRRTKKPRTLSKDSANCSQLANPVDPSFDANKNCADSNDSDTPMIDTCADVVRPQEIESAPAKDQESRCSQQANPINPSDDASNKGADSNDMNTPMIDTLGANENLVRPQETETSAAKDQEVSSSQQFNPIDPSDDANKEDTDSNDMDTPTTDTFADMVRPDEIETAPAKSQEASSSQQANPVDPSDDANKKDADSNDMDTPTIDTPAEIVRPQEMETAPAKDPEASSSREANPIGPSDDANKKDAVSNDIDTLAANVNMVEPHDSAIAAVKDQDASQLDTGIVNNVASQVTPARDNVEPLRNETPTDAAKDEPEGDSSPQNQDEEGTVSAEDAKAEQKPQ